MSMNDCEELLTLLKTGKLPRDTLNDCLAAANGQLSNYDQALALLNKCTDPLWTYNTYKDILRLGSMVKTEILTYEEWSLMLPDAKLQTRQATLVTILEGQKSFREAKDLIERQLQGGNKKSWWRRMFSREKKVTSLVLQCPFCDQHIEATPELSEQMVSCPNAACRREFQFPGDCFEASSSRFGGPSLTTTRLERPMEFSKFGGLHEYYV